MFLLGAYTLKLAASAGRKPIKAIFRSKITGFGVTDKASTAIEGQAPGVAYLSREVNYRLWCIGAVDRLRFVYCWGV